MPLYHCLVWKALPPDRYQAFIVAYDTAWDKTYDHYEATLPGSSITTSIDLPTDASRETTDALVGVSGSANLKAIYVSVWQGMVRKFNLPPWDEEEDRNM